MVTKELEKYNFNVAALFKTRLTAHNGMIDQGYRENELEQQELALRFDIQLQQDLRTINDQLLSMRLSLKSNFYVTNLITYVFTLTNSKKIKNEFYTDLLQARAKFPNNGRLILAGCMNARVGCETEKWLGIIGACGARNCDNNGELEQKLFLLATVPFMLTRLRKSKCQWTGLKVQLKVSVLR